MADVSERGGHIYTFTHASGGAYVHQGDAYYPLAPEFAEEHRCHQVFKTSDYVSHKDTIVQKASQTCRWVLDHPLFNRWRRGNDHNVLWISADPGCGKSVLARSLIDHDLPSDKLTTCYFFFKDGIPEQESLANALSAILHQLFDNQPSLLRHAVREWRKIGAGLRHDVNALWKIICKATADPNAWPTICVIDALDECSRKDRDDLITLLGEYCSAGSSETRNDSLKFLLTSRPYHDIQACFEPYMREMSVTWLRGEVENDVLCQEVDLVIGNEIDKLAADFALDARHQTLLRWSLANMQQRTYLWWNLVRHDIRKVYQYSWCPNEVSVNNLVNKLPVTVDEAYERLLQGVAGETIPKAKMKFLIMLAARRPMSTSEMALMLQTILSLQNRHSIAVQVDERQLVEHIRGWCGLFIFLRRAKLYFIHTTARNFLLRLNDQSMPSTCGKWKQSLGLGDAHKTLAIACCGYLRNRKVSGSWRAQTKTIKQKKSFSATENSFLEYVAEFATYHVAEAIKSLNVHRGIFFISRLPSYGMDLQTVDTNGMSLLHHLVQRTGPSLNYEAIGAVLSRGGLVRTADREGMHCLHYASRHNDLRLIALLIQHRFPADEAIERHDGADQNNEDSGTNDVVKYKSHVGKGLTALHAAVLYGNLESLSLFMHIEADISITDHYGRTALHTAVAMKLPGRSLSDAWEEDELMVGYIWDFPWREDEEEYWEKVNEGAKKVRLQILKTLCTKSPGLSRIPDSAGQTPLHLLRYDDAHYSAISALAALLEFGADPIAKDRDGVTPLHLAAASDNLQCFKMMVQAVGPGSVSIVDIHGRTSLHYAAMAANSKNLKHLVADADGILLINYMDNRGQTPLQTSLFDKISSPRSVLPSPDKVQILVASGARVDLTNRCRRDALAHYLAHHLFMAYPQIVEIVGILLANGANASFLENGQNLAHLFVGSCLDEANVEVLQMLRQYGTPIFATDSQGRSILHHAAEAGTISEAFLNYLSDDLDITTLDVHGKTPLMYAQDMAHIERHPDLYNPDRWEHAVRCLLKHNRTQM